MRRLVAALSIVVVLALAWSGAWFWLAGLADREAASTLEEIARNGVEVECSDRAVIGFPFALRIACGETAVAEVSTGTKANLAGATGGVSVLAPLTARIALTAPVRVESPLLDGPAEIRFEQAAIDVGMGLNGPRDASFDAAEFSAAISAPGVPERTVAATSAEGSLGPSAAGGSDIVVAFTEFTFATDGTHFPPLTGSAAGELSAPPRALASGRAGLSMPLAIRAIEIALESEGAHFFAEGDISIDVEGILDGAMTLRIAGVEALPVFIAALPPEWRKIANAVTAGLFVFGQPTTLDGNAATEVKVKIERGNATIGPIEFTLPRVPL